MAHALDTTVEWLVTQILATINPRTRRKNSPVVPPRSIPNKSCRVVNTAINGKTGTRSNQIRERREESGRMPFPQRLAAECVLQVMCSMSSQEGYRGAGARRGQSTAWGLGEGGPTGEGGALSTQPGKKGPYRPSQNTERCVGPS